MDIATALVLGAVPGALILSAFFILSLITPYARRSGKDFLQDRTVFDPSGEENNKFSKLLRPKSGSDDEFEHTSPEVYVSVVVPAMNEEDRLPVMLDDCLPYLEKRAEESSEFTYEVIVVDDGSKDKTATKAFEYSKKLKHGQLRVLKLPKNVGKGGAVRFGTCCARGQIILFADADGATTFSEFGKLETKLRDLCSDGEYFECDFAAIAIGSRAHLEEQAIAERSIFRTILSKGFQWIVRFFAVRTVKDTQCGFKMFSRAAAANIFPKLHIERWAFDVELLYLAEQAQIPMEEIAVEWKEIDGSKITPVFTWIQMGRDILLIWFRYTFRIWSKNGVSCN